MNGRRMGRMALAAGMLLAAAACDRSTQGGNVGDGLDTGSLEGARIGGDFTLVDQDGRPRAWKDFAGRYRLIYFGYTYCPDVCPIDLQRITQGLRAFEQKAPDRAAKVQPIFISLDPDRDRPAVVKSYVAAFHPRLVGLTGTPEQIADVAKKFVIVYGKEQPKGASDYLVSHSRTPYLFGPDGKPIALVPVDDPSTPDRDEGAPGEVAATLDRWVR